MYQEIKAHLLEASDRQFDASLKPRVEKWDEPPTPLQILEVLDQCVHCALASGFVVNLLGIMYDQRLKETGLSNDEVVKYAVWRT